MDTVFLLNLVMGDEGKILEYIPHNTYLMMGTHAPMAPMHGKDGFTNGPYALGTEKAAAALTPDYGVDWVGEYSPHYKLANEIFSNPYVPTILVSCAAADNTGCGVGPFNRMSRMHPTR